VQFEQLGLPGAYVLRPRIAADERGTFVKTFHLPTFEARGLRTDWQEEYYSSSVRGVIRGMHFQLPPADHAKLVFCVAGAVTDVVVDLRCGSPTEKQHRAVELSAESGLGLYIPTGCAHGFVSTSDTSTMWYKVTSVYAPEQDSGIAWDSIGFDWPVVAPFLSERDRGHTALNAFESPFTFDPERPSW
jgi:dTDP-4-dehydrorhamnose 3,5-epimerase